MRTLHPPVMSRCLPLLPSCFDHRAPICEASGPHTEGDANNTHQPVHSSRCMSAEQWCGYHSWKNTESRAGGRLTVDNRCHMRGRHRRAAQADWVGGGGGRKSTICIGCEWRSQWRRPLSWLLTSTIKQASGRCAHHACSSGCQSLTATSVTA